MRSKSYHDSLIQSLKDPEEAAGYLNVALEDGDKKMFLIALRNVAEAYGGMAKISRLTKLNRANLYKMFSEHGHPEIQSIHKVLDSFGLQLSISVKSEPKPKLRRAA